MNCKRCGKRHTSKAAQRKCLRDCDIRKSQEVKRMEEVAIARELAREIKEEKTGGSGYLEEEGEKTEIDCLWAMLLKRELEMTKMRKQMARLESQVMRQASGSKGIGDGGVGEPAQQQTNNNNSSKLFGDGGVENGNNSKKIGDSRVENNNSSNKIEDWGSVDVNLDSIVLSVEPSSLPLLLPQMVLLGNTTFRERGDKQIKEMANLSQFPSCFFSRTKVGLVRAGLKQAGVVFEGSNSTMKITESSGVYVPIKTLVGILERAGVGMVRVQAHGLKNPWMLWDLRGVKLVRDKGNRLDVGVFVETGDIRGVWGNHPFKKYQLFASNFEMSTISGNWDGDRFKVYSTLVHHLKARCPRFSSKPWLVQKNRQLRASLRAIDSFLGKFVEEPGKLGVRFELTILDPSMAEISEYVDRLLTFKRKISEGLRFKGVAVEDYVWRARVVIQEWGVIGSNEEELSEMGRWRYAQLLQGLGWADRRLEGYLMRRGRQWDLLEKKADELGFSGERKEQYTLNNFNDEAVREGLESEEIGGPEEEPVLVVHPPESQ